MSKRQGVMEKEKRSKRKRKSKKQEQGQGKGQGAKFNRETRYYINESEDFWEILKPDSAPEPVNMPVR